MSNVQHYDIVEHSIVKTFKELQDHVLDGWLISPTNQGDVVGLYGGTFTVSLYRDHNTVANLQEKAAGVQEVAKPDRAAILAKARAARGKGKNQTNDE